MGVTGLWNLVDSVGHPIDLESLHNKVIAIDLSLWINQSIKGIRSRNGQTLENAHVLGLFNRICKLLFYKIKPIFVFDGKCPQLKQNTIAKRVEQRLKAIDKSREASIKILHNYIATQLSTSDQRLPTNQSLPSLQSSLIQMSDNKSFKIYEELAETQKHRGITDDYEDSSSDSEPRIVDNYKNIQNFDSMDLNSEDFNSLPTEMRYEILTEMKQKFKGYRNTNIMPKESNDFSKYQLERLLKKRTLQSKIEDTIKQLNGENSEDLLQELDNKGFHNRSELSAGRLVSDESTRFVFLKKSQTTDPQMIFDKNIDTNIHKEEHIAGPSLVTIEDNSVDNQSVVISDSSDFEEQNPKLTENPPISSEINLKTNLTNNQKFQNSSNDNSFHEKTIEISDESEEELNSDICVNKIIETNSNQSIEKNLKFETKSDTEKSDFTRIKTIELEDSDSDSSDEEFEEVLPQTSHLSDKPIIENELQNKESNDTKSIDKNETSLNFDEIFDTNEEFEDINDSIPEEFQAKGETSNLDSNNVYSEPKASTSQSNEFKAISREELLETCREVNKQNRFANHTTDQMMTDCQDLLRLFGIPFVISPTEAEAQCAALEQMSLVDGTITDDSDILLFGAKTVYKNFFTSSKFVELFDATDIETRFGLTRSSLICIAMLCGSDYTDGVDGVGAVTATEILSEFRGDGLQPLIDLKNWWQNKKNSKDKRPENKIRAKFMKLKLSEGFPNSVIFDAYMKPTVDTSTEKFVWGMPQLNELRSYAALKFGWTVDKCDQLLLPVMKKVNEKKTQMKIDNYFKIQVQPKDISMVSKRINRAIDKLKGVESEPQTSRSNSSTGLSALSQRVKNQRKRRQTKTNKSGGQSKRLQTIKSKPQEINLSENSESD